MFGGMNLQRIDLVQRSRSEAGRGFQGEAILCPRLLYLVVSEPLQADPKSSRMILSPLVSIT